MSERCVISAGQFVKSQLYKMGVPLDHPELQLVLDQAGGGLYVDWLARLFDGLVNKLTIRHLIGLRRLLGIPIDTIIGLEYTRPANRDKMAGLQRIRHELGDRKPLTKKHLCGLADCSAQIISRIDLFSRWAVINEAADIETPAAEIDRILYETFSLAVLIRLKYSIHSNIDDIVGLGEYDAEAVFLVGKGAAIDYNNKEVPDSDIMDAEAKKAHDKRIIAQFASSRAASQPDGDTVTGFRPQGI